MKFLTRKCAASSMTSRPSRGAWIEINKEALRWQMQNVAPLAGRVD